MDHFEPKNVFSELFSLKNHNNIKIIQNNGTIGVYEKQTKIPEIK
jgi:hypothetical protein